MANTNTNSYGLLAFNQGSTDLLAMVFDSPRETSLKATASQIKTDAIIAASNFDLNIEQSSSSEGRFAGETADSNSLSIHTATFHSSMSMPLYASVLGWVDTAFAYLWEQARISYWGTGTAAIGNVINSDGSNSIIAANSSVLYTNNIADFMAFNLPFIIQIVSTDNTVSPETVQVTAINKRARQLTLSSPTQLNHSVGDFIVYRPTYSYFGPYKEPSFSLMSYREGMLSPTLVNKITITATANEQVKVNVEFISLGVYRAEQIDLRPSREILLKAYSFLAPKRIISGTAVSLSSVNANTGTFGLSLPIGNPLLAGYQGLQLDSVLVNGFTLTIENNLEEVYTTHSLKNGGDRQLENSSPFMVVSNGRKISGSIEYRSSMEPWQLAERISGPSSLANGGLQINYGVFALAFPEIAWKPSKSKGNATENQSRTLEWDYVAEKPDAMPQLLFSSQI